MVTPSSQRTVWARLLLGILFVLAVGYLGALWALDFQRERRVYHANPQTLLAACREMITQRGAYQPAQRDSEHVRLDLREHSVTPDLPRPIRELRPYFIDNFDSSVFVRVSGKMMLCGFAPGAQERGEEKITDGLWIIRSKR
jgi:hypothetical protein